MMSCSGEGILGPKLLQHIHRGRTFAQTLSILQVLKVAALHVQHPILCKGCMISTGLV